MKTLQFSFSLSIHVTCWTWNFDDLKAFICMNDTLNSAFAFFSDRFCLNNCCLCSFENKKDKEKHKTPQTWAITLRKLQAIIGLLCKVSGWVLWALRSNNWENIWKCLKMFSLSMERKENLNCLTNFRAEFFKEMSTIQRLSCVRNGQTLWKIFFRWFNWNVSDYVIS